ncbi:MAG: HAMP domain-containing protein, partial [Chloroflexi bacterium]|nr:HAMP domain-containing protein [Chloroflexota bacterium]
MRLTIKTKLIGGFLVVVAMLLVVFGVAYNGLTSMGDAADELAVSASLDDAVMSMIIGLLDGMDVESRSLIAGFDAGMEAEFQASVDAFDAAEDTIRSLGTAQQGVLLDEMIIDHDNFQASVQATLGLVRDGKQGEAVSNSFDITDPIIEELRGDLGELEEEVEAFGDSALENAASTESNAITVQIIIVIIASILAVSLGYWLARMISTGVGQMLVAAEGIADGDLDQVIDVKSKDEIGDMANAFTRMVEYLKGMAGAATTIADGDLTVDVVPKSEKDVLGNAFSTMIATLRSTIGQVNDAAT